MEQLARIEARLDSLSGLGELVGALRSMAASRVREAQDALAATRAFRDILDRAIAEIAPACHAAETGRKDDGAAMVIIASQQGFAGAFNERIVDAALSERRPDEKLCVIGRRGEVALAVQGITAGQAQPMTSRAGGVVALARRLSRQLSGSSSVRIVHAHHVGGANYNPSVRPVLPLHDPSSNGRETVPLHHIAPDRLFAALASEYLFAEIADALMDSLASENAARLTMMDGASRNIEDKLERLRRDAHVARQDELTTDMIDVVTGAAAIFDRRQDADKEPPLPRSGSV